MPLSEHEQRLLDQLEQQLNAEDPTFAHSMSSQKAPTGSGLAARHLVAGILIFLLGLGVILAGVSTKLIVIGVTGFLVAVAGIYLATVPPKNAKTSSSSSSFSKAPKKQSSFMQGLEEKWDERKFGGR